jgi:hypothetical protein
LPTTKKNILTEYFSEIGKIEKCELSNDGNAIIQFFDFESVIESLKYNGADIEGRSCSVALYYSNIKKISND